MAGSVACELAPSSEARTLRKPKLVFLACYFPPARSSASVRTWNIAKYLARSGWEVAVVTPEPSVWRHVNDPHKVTADLEHEGIRRITTRHWWRCLSPDHLRCWNSGMGWMVGGMCRMAARRLGIDPALGWIQAASRACRQLSSDSADVVLATGDPFGSFQLAKRLSVRLKCGYVLDYRDVWALPSDGHMAARLLKQEAELMQASAAVTTVAPSLLNGRNSAPEKTTVISNGFDPDEMAQVAATQFEHFAIVYTGIFYAPKRVVSPLMETFRRLDQTGCRTSWRFHYYGPDEEHVRSEAARFGMAHRIVLHGQVSRGEVLSALKGAGVSVVITSVLRHCEPEDRGIVTGKIFDSIGLRVPILAVGPPGSDVESIFDTTGLGRLFGADDIDGMVKFLLAAMSGEVPPTKQPERYAWPYLISRFDSVLRTAVAKYRPQHCLEGTA